MASNGYNMTSVNPYQWDRIIEAIGSGGESGVVEALDNIKNAIIDINYRQWVKIGFGVTSFNLNNLPNDTKEVLIVVKQSLPSNEITSVQFTIPKRAFEDNETYVDGYYYSAQYYACFGVKIHNKIVTSPNAWNRNNYGSTLTTGATFDLYYR